MWTRRLTRPGEWPDDWLIHQDGVLMGRVHLDYISGRDRKVWFWFKQWGHGAQGHALEQACKRYQPPAASFGAIQ